MRVRSLAIVALLVAVTAALLTYGAQSSRASAAATACGATNPNNKVRATFELPSARLFWAHFPGETRPAPELDIDTSAFVVVFEGATTVIGIVSGPGKGEAAFRPVTLNNVVCVYLPPSELYPYGEPLVYYDVNLAGFTP